VYHSVLLDVPNLSGKKKADSAIGDRQITGNLLHCKGAWY
jgi:hypothetical protein